MVWFWGDPTFILLLPALALALYAQFKVNSTFQRYSEVRSLGGSTGAQVARALLNGEGLDYVRVEMTEGQLSDHYDPRTRVVRLSPEVYHSSSLAALGVAAHESGHALQHAQKYVPLGLRNNFFPVANLGSQLAFPLFFLGFLFQGRFLMDLGILLFTAAVAFQVLTLPVELNASRRALALLQSHGFVTSRELGPVREVLSAAALTYVAATAMAAVQLLRLFLLRNMRDER